MSLTVMFLKRKAKKAYLQYRALLDECDCGTSLAEVFSLRVSNVKRMFNETMDKLQKIDPTTPTNRL
jgi:hypothetical protein